jgi:long-subunit acyl-CoA synthetase (AMP-forming)
MKRIFDRIEFFAKERPHRLALSDGARSLSYRELQREIDRAAPAATGERVGLLMENSCAWAIADLALQKSGAACVPMPPFFSDNQLRHLINNAGLDAVVTDQPLRIIKLLQTPLSRELNIAGQRFDLFLLNPSEKFPLPPRTAKITYTSGTTGQPKGVCLTGEAAARVAVSLSDAVAAAEQDRALTLLPLSTLLANIGGVYAPLYSGSSALLPDLADCGIAGSTGVNADTFIATLNHVQPSVTILVPHLLKVLVAAAAQGAPVPSSLRYIAVGGAPLSSGLLKQARALGLPVYQGYGLSEAASVVSMSLPGRRHGDSAGPPLPHVEVRIAADSEIMVSGNLFSGYLGQAPRSGNEWPTGDIGFLDSNGELHITGRKKTSFATAHGRKLAPEWIESELTGSPSIAQAVLFGEGRSFNTAIIVPSNAAAVPNIADAVAEMNHNLPDYARVSRWIIADEPFSIRNGLANGAGTLDRRAIAIKYSPHLEKLYQGDGPNAIL